MKDILALLHRSVILLCLFSLTGAALGQAPPLEPDAHLPDSREQDDAPSLPEKWSIDAMADWSDFLIKLDDSNLSHEQGDEIRARVIRSLAAEPSWIDNDKLRHQGLKLCKKLTAKRNSSLWVPLHSALTPRYSNESWLKALKPSEHMLARDFLPRSDRYAARRIADELWVMHSDYRISISLSDLNVMIRQSWRLSLDDDSAQLSTAKILLEHVWDNFLTNKKYLRSAEFDVEKMTLVANAVTWMHPLEQRSEIGLRLATAWIEDEEWFLSLNVKQLLQLQNGLQSYFIRSEVDCPQLALDWVNAGDQWHQINAADAYLLLHQLKDRRVVSTSDDYEKLRAKAAQGVVSYLMDHQLSEQADWSSLTFDEMMTYISKVEGLAEQSDAVSLQNRILQFYFYEKSRLRAIDVSTSVHDFKPLADLAPGKVTAGALYAKRHLEGGEWKALPFKKAIRLLDYSADDSKEANRFRKELLAYLSTHPELGEITPVRAVSHLDSLQAFSESKFRKDSELLRQKMADTVIQNTIANASVLKPSDIQKLEVLTADASAQGKQQIAAWSLAFARNRIDWLLHYGDEGVEMAMSIDRFIQSSIKEPEQHDKLINEMYVDVILFDGQTFPPQFSLNNGTSFHHGYPRMWNPKGSIQRNLLKSMRPEAIAALRKRLLEQDRPASFAVTVLVHAARSGDVGELHSLGTYFSEKASEASGDVKARWLMARAYAAEAETSPTWSVLHGQQYLEEALSAAESDAVKQDIVRWLVQGQAALGFPDRARALLEKYGSIYERDKEEDLRQQVAAAEEGRRKWIQRQVDYETDQRRKLLLQRLVKARANGNQAQIERYERMLKQFDQQ